MEIQSDNLDDLIPEEEKKVISALERCYIKCPHLQKEGKYFYYCGVNMKEVKEKNLDIQQQIHLRHTKLEELRLYCRDDFESCSLYCMEKEVVNQ